MISRRAFHVRTLVAVSAAATAILIAIPSASQADPTSITEIQNEIRDLYHESEIATERYNAYQGELHAAERHLQATNMRVDDQQQRIGDLLKRNGVYAALAYRNGGIDETLQLLLADDPEQFLAKATTLDQLSARQAAALRQVEVARQDLLSVRQQAEQEIAQIADLKRSLDEERELIEQHLRKANELLNLLEAEQRAFLAETGKLVVPQSVLDNLPGGRAGTAVRFAIDQIGEPYVWGASGPNAWDCSGLTLRAWEAAGVQLPRVSSEQAQSGTPVSSDDLRPGDLVAFFSPISHIGIYLGEGLMVHATHPGSVVMVTPIDTMPLTAATRVG